MPTTIESFGSTSLVEDGSFYFLNPNGGSAVELSYAGAPVVDGQFDQFGGHWVPIGAEQTATGYEVAGRSLAPTSIRCGSPTIAAITSQVLLTSRRERAPRCNRSRPVSSKT